MPVESDSDRLDVLSDFGVAITIAGREITGIFDHAYEDALGIQVDMPVITVRDIDVPEGRGTALSIGGVGYTIAEKQPDGLGITLVILQKV